MTNSLPSTGQAPKTRRRAALSVIFNIRDARGLNSDEKSFLYTVESRGITYTAHPRIRADMGLSKTTFYKTRSSLLQKKLIIAIEETKLPTAYVVNTDKIAELAEASRADDLRDRESWWETGQFVLGTQRFTMETGLSASPDTKKTQTRSP